MPSISFSDFQKLDIKIGTVVSAEKVPNADKLTKLVLDLGDQQRQIIAGIAEIFPDPSALVGQQLPILVNLEPKTFCGLESQGMILAADVDGRPVLLHPAEKVPPGSAVR